MFKNDDQVRLQPLIAKIEPMLPPTDTTRAQRAGIVERHVDLLAGELRLGNDEQKMRSAAFVFLVARTAFDLTDREAFEGNTDPTLAAALRSRRTGSQR